MNTFPVTKTKPLHTLHDLAEAVRAAAQVAGRDPREVYLDEPVVVTLTQRELTDGSFVYDVQIEVTA